MEDLPERPVWLPESCYAELASVGERPSPVVKMARRLCFAPVMEGYWRSKSGNLIEARPAELWNLAECAEISRQLKNVPGGQGRVGADPRWFLKSRPERRKLCKRIERLASELRDTVSESHFDLPTGMLLLVGRATSAEGRISEDGPTLTLILEALKTYARLSEEKVKREPMFSGTNDQLLNATLAILYRFHLKHFGLAESNATRRAGDVAALVNGLSEPVPENRVRNAIRGVRQHS